jgi:hypothetical protein
MATLPVHSHHRAPLLHVLSQQLPSSTAASLLHAAPSTVRLAKRKDYSGSDLVQQKYASGVKRQRIADSRQEELCDFIAAACPTKSGEKSVSYHQYTTDTSLYSAYRSSTAAPVSLNTFLRLKRWMRVRRAGRYLGQFDCSKCITLKQLQHKPGADLSGEEATDLRKCLLHAQSNFRSGSTTSRCALSCVRVSC